MHKHYELARRAHYHTSFTPEKRAHDFCAAFDATLIELEALGVSEAKRAKYEALVVKHMQAKGRCFSSMITGPANFPVARAERANRVEHARSLECSAYYDKIVREAKQEAYYTAHPEARPVMAGDADALERLQHQLETMRGKQTNMIAVNKLLRKGDNLGVYALMGTAAGAILCDKRGWWGNGYAPFELTNNRANMKRVEGRIAELSREKATGNTEQTLEGVRVVENTEAMRLQLFFEGKPSREIIAELKGHGMKWAPSLGAWQRQLTENARYAVYKLLLPKITKAA